MGHASHGLRLGLCCTFLDRTVARFRHTTARYAGGLAPPERRDFLRQIALHNADALVAAISWCSAHGVGAFRVHSAMWPLATHPALGYALDALDADGRVRERLVEAGALAARCDVRLSLHPDQFVVLGSERDEVVAASVRETEHQAEVAALIGAAQLTLHGGGAAGGKAAALERLLRGIDRLSPRAREHLVLENDDRTYTVADLLPVVARAGLALVYDVHHHRVNPDGLGVEEATEAAAATWGGREPWLHVSSPANGWDGTAPQRHADHIDPADLPASWRGRTTTLDVEAKAKEDAVLALRRWLERAGWPLQAPLSTCSSA